MKERETHDQGCSLWICVLVLIYTQVHCSAVESSSSCWYQTILEHDSILSLTIAVARCVFAWLFFRGVLVDYIFFLTYNNRLRFFKYDNWGHCSFLIDFFVRSKKFGFSFCYNGKNLRTITNCQEDIYVSVQNSFYLSLFTQCLSERKCHCLMTWQDTWLFMYRHYLTMSCNPSQCHFDFTLIFHFKENSYNLYPSPHTVKHSEAQCQSLDTKIFQ